MSDQEEPTAPGGSGTSPPVANATAETSATRTEIDSRPLDPAIDVGEALATVASQSGSARKGSGPAFCNRLIT